MSKPWFKKNYKRVSKYKGDDPSDVNNLPNYGYLGFRLYFPDADHINEEMLKKHVNTFKTFFQQNQTCYSLPEIAKDKLFNLDFKQITGDENILTYWPEFKEELSNDSEYCLNCISLAMHDLITKYYEEQNEQNLILFEPITARICNVEPFLHLRELRFQYIGKLVTIKGTVIKTSDVKLIAQYLTFTCSNCFGTQISKQPDNVYTVPLRCKTKDCKAKTNFSVELDSPYDKFVSWQSVKIQEPHWADQYDHARTPRTLDCELTEDLVNTCFPGDDVTISGIINKIHCAQNSFALLVQSLCPNIYGHEMVKAGLLLALFGGTKSESFRGESHVLVVGDPGLGKSQMLQACTNVAPRGVYVCGNTSTSSGLTVTMTRDGEGEFSLEAGALMLADQGCCCIDEFDKMPTQHAALLEAMEQQTISIAKAGTICSIPTRVTMLAAANPVGGHYNKARTIAENLKMNSPMLSRFDLIFILLDTVNEETDWLLSKHVVSIHLEQSERSRIQNNSVSIVESSNGNLRDRLKFDASKADLVPHNLFRKYIAYAQKYVKPQLSDDAKSVIKQYYLSLRKQFQTGDCTPVTTRQANSLIRLTQARAKAELREVATKQDAEDVVEIMKWSLNDIFSDGTGVLDKTRSQNGTGTSTKAQITRLLRIVQRISEIETRSIFGTNELKQLSEQAGIAKNKFNTVLENLNLQGFLLKKGQGKYQLVTADF
ncbi:DNA helicase MCM8-like isoform X4 [Diorhabda carinulata]|uniref:DNA helicase MCM8-like isoform X4 n=1 Tax=Diorhabda carinulata TaxID=1163345 RepID=UPI0025A27E01|nr:DNA helicase MCM8-like isoform X4 [Diorhabda carinulata]